MVSGRSSLLDPGRDIECFTRPGATLPCRHHRGASKRCALPAGGRIQEEAGVVRIASGLHGPEFNPVFITSPRADLAQVIEASKSFMASANVSDWRLVAFDATISKVEGPAISAGLHSGRLMPGMALDPIPVRAPPLPDGFRVRRVKDAELWRTMIRVGNTAFGGGATPGSRADSYPSLIPPRYGDTSDLLRRCRVRLVSGFLITESGGFSSLEPCPSIAVGDMGPP